MVCLSLELGPLWPNWITCHWRNPSLFLELFHSVWICFCLNITLIVLLYVFVCICKYRCVCVYLCFCMSLCLPAFLSSLSSPNLLYMNRFTCTAWERYLTASAELNF